MLKNKPGATSYEALKAAETDYYLRGPGREEFADRAAAVMVEINGVHPFPEGNGRTQSAFMGELAREAGYSLDFSVVSRERMIQASIAGNEKSDPGMMSRLEILCRLPGAAIQRSHQSACRKSMNRCSAKRAKGSRLPRSGR